jgi:hypothetical protein
MQVTTANHPVDTLCIAVEQRATQQVTCEAVTNSVGRCHGGRSDGCMHTCAHVITPTHLHVFICCLKIPLGAGLNYLCDDERVWLVTYLQQPATAPGRTYSWSLTGAAGTSDRESHLHSTTILSVTQSLVVWSHLEHVVLADKTEA